MAGKQSKRCLECKKKLTGRQILYCSDRCKYRQTYLRRISYYISYIRRHKNKKRKYLRDWFKNNRDKQKEYYSRGYKKNKYKWVARNRLNKWIDRLDKRERKSILVCNVCKTNKNIEAHHLKYPISIKDIKKAVKVGDIYWLCRKHHGELHRKHNFK